MSVQQQYNQQNTITGYTVSESLTAELHDLATAGQTITNAVHAGGNAVRVNAVSLDLADQMTTLMAKVRAGPSPMPGTRPSSTRRRRARGSAGC